VINKKDQPYLQNLQIDYIRQGLNEGFEFTNDAEKDRRMAICKECPHFGEILTQCGICGCFLEAKTRLVGFHCALDQIGEEPKW
jgi:hypothetical protein